MLAKTFKTAAELRIREVEYNALVEVLYQAEDETISLDEIYMPQFHCGTRHCLAGWANTIDPAAFPEVAPSGDCAIGHRLPLALHSLFGLYTNRDTLECLSGERVIKNLRQYLEKGTADQY